MEKPLYIEETKMYLNTNNTFKQIAVHFDCNPQLVSGKIYKTIQRLVFFFDLDNLGILYPYDKSMSDYGYRKFENARKHSDFWNQIISDYENNVKLYKHNLPIQVADSRKISDLTVSEFTDLVRQLLSS